MDTKGVLVVISGFSGAGKGTLVNALLNQYSNYALSISATTRAPRENEEDGKHYFFKTREEFEHMIVEDELMEYAEYAENYYGTPKEYVFQQLEAGKDVILEIEVQGALKIKEKFPETLLIFVTPPSAKELLRRLTSRGTESKEVIDKRMARALEESYYIDKYEYLLVNDQLEEAVCKLHELIQSQHNIVFRNLPFVKQIQEELKDIQ